MNTNYEQIVNGTSSKQLQVAKAIAARATLSGLSYIEDAYGPVKKPTKFIVTLKPVKKKSENTEDSNKYESHQYINHRGGEKALAEKHHIFFKSATDPVAKSKAILDAFGLLSNSNFIQIDQNYGKGENLKLKTMIPPSAITALPLPLKASTLPHQLVLCNRNRLAGGADAPVQRCCSRSECRHLAKKERTREKEKKRKKRRICLTSCCCEADDRGSGEIRQEKKTTTPARPSAPTKPPPPPVVVPKQQEPPKTAAVDKPKPKAKPTKTDEKQTPPETDDLEINSSSSVCLCCRRELKKESTPPPPPPPPAAAKEKPTVKEEEKEAPTRPAAALPKKRVSSSHTQTDSACPINCNRIENLEKQIETMRWELSRIKRDIIPQQEFLRCSALERGLHQLNVLLMEMKEKCLTDVASTLTGATICSRSERLQKTDYYKKPSPITCACQTTGIQSSKCISSTTTGTQADPKPTTQTFVLPNQDKKCPKNDAATQSNNSMSLRSFLQYTEQKPHQNAKELPKSEPPLERVPIVRRKDSPKVLYQRTLAPDTTDPSSQSTPNNLADISSFCMCCDRTKQKPNPCTTDLSGQIKKLITSLSPYDIALTILLQTDNLYHINVAIMKTGESLGCIYATEDAIKVADDEHVFEEFLTFFIVDSRNTPEQKNRILSHTFFFIRK